jgi:response regulator of citrate/malate metabolism
MKMPPAEQPASDALLLVDPDPATGRARRLTLSGLGTCHIAGTAAEARTVLRTEPVKAVFIEQQLPDGSGMALLEALHQRNHKIKAVLLSAEADPELLLKAVNNGGLFRYLVHPVTDEVLLKTAKEALRSYEIDAVQEQLALHASEIDQQLNSVPYWLYRLQVIARGLAGQSTRILGTALTVILGSTLLLLLLGTAVIVLLYFLKSLAGIDILDKSHLNDVISP